MHGIFIDPQVLPLTLFRQEDLLEEPHMMGLIDSNPSVSLAGALSFFDFDPSLLYAVALQPLHGLDGVPKFAL